MSWRSSIDGSANLRADSSTAGQFQSGAEAGDLQHDYDADPDQAGKKGGYVYDSSEEKEAVKQQRQAIWDWLRSMGSNLFRDGVNLTKVSLPVVLFEPRSFLERLSDNWAFLDLLEKAAETRDPVERMKYLVPFVISGLRRTLSLDKPFNPILGETYQADFGNGVELYCEQISHHPPVSAWQVMDAKKKFHFFGQGNYIASARANTVRGHQSGTNKVAFASDGATVSWELPSLQVKGVLWGIRVLRYGGTVSFKDDLNNLHTDVTLDTSASSGFMSSLFGRKKQGKADQLRGTLMRGSEVLDVCHGSWLTHFEWEGGVAGGKIQRLWDCQTSVPRLPEPIANPLSSDCRFREDARFLKEGNLQLAQEWKGKLEQQQRHDQALRKEGNKALS